MQTNPALAYSWGSQFHLPGEISDKSHGPFGYLLVTRCHSVYYTAAITSQEPPAHVPSPERCPICFCRSDPPSAAPVDPILDPQLWGFNVSSFILERAQKVGWWDG